MSLPIFTLITVKIVLFLQLHVKAVFLLGIVGILLSWVLLGSLGHIIVIIVIFPSTARVSLLYRAAPNFTFHPSNAHNIPNYEANSKK